MSTDTQLAAVPPKETALKVFSTDKGLEPWLQQVRTKVDEFLKVLPELNTVKGREAYASMAYKIAKSKTALDALGKDISAQQKEIPKKIDAERKRVWDTLELWQKEVRKPLDDWQAAEDKRLDAHNARLDLLRQMPLNLVGSTSAHVQGLIDQAEAIAIDDSWEEFKAEAGQAKDLTLKALRDILAELHRYEAEQAELALLRAEAEARAKADHEAAIARAAAEKAQREANERAAAELAAAAKREQDLKDQAAAQQRAAEQAARDAEAAAAQQALQLKLAAEQAERIAAQAEANRLAAIQQAEQDRIAAEKRQAEAVEQARLAEIARQEEALREEQRLAAAREADKAHKAKINRAALDAFIAGGMTDECARQAVTLIAQRKIPNIAITY
ncbi:hypothetical protein [Pseudomonas sp. NPDC088444]|uniref:hypothetical protein n=1 Tax=Pseudomonas sp. NPDC088444 TaxID=3364456 RepID=UPI00384E37CC